uniref:Uncharacterized protein n=1 Tax=Glossina austeni TaxID=7395 RepID=A0A1A9VSN5_GLOAU
MDKPFENMENAEIFSKPQQNRIINRNGVVELEPLKKLLDQCLNELNCLKNVLESVLKPDIGNDVLSGNFSVDEPINKMPKSHKLKKKIVKASRNTKFEGKINSLMHQNITDEAVLQLVVDSMPVKGKGRKLASKSRTKHVMKAATFQPANALYTNVPNLTTPATTSKPEVSLDSNCGGNKDQVDPELWQFPPHTSQQTKKRGRAFGSKNQLKHIINTETFQQGQSLYSKVISLSPLANVSHRPLNINLNTDGNKTRMESQSDVNKGKAFTIVHSLSTHMGTSNSKKDINRNQVQLSPHTLQQPKKRGRKLGSKNRPKQSKTETFQEVHPLYSMMSTLNTLPSISQSAANLNPNIGKNKLQMESQSQLSSHTSQQPRKRGRKLGSKNGPKHIDTGEISKQMLSLDGMYVSSTMASTAPPMLNFNTNVDGNKGPMILPLNFSQQSTKYGSKLLTETHIPQRHRKVITLQQKQPMNNLRVWPLQYALQHVRGDQITSSNLSRDSRWGYETMPAPTESLTNDLLSQDIAEEACEYERFRKFKIPEISETLDLLSAYSTTSKTEIDSKLIDAPTRLPSEFEKVWELRVSPEVCAMPGSMLIIAVINTGLTKTTKKLIEVPAGEVPVSTGASYCRSHCLVQARDDSLKYIKESDKDLIAGFGLNSHPVDGNLDVCVKVVKITDVSLLVLPKEKERSRA